jgi:hypothetical protein
MISRINIIGDATFFRRGLQIAKIVNRQKLDGIDAERLEVINSTFVAGLNESTIRTAAGATPEDGCAVKSRTCIS